METEASSHHCTKVTETDKNIVQFVPSYKVSYKNLTKMLLPLYICTYNPQERNYD